MPRLELLEDRCVPTIGINEFSLGITANAQPYGITAGPDGNLWFTEFAADQIGRITPTGAITEFSIPTANAEPQGITVGPDGNLWFTEFGADQIGRITPSGTITEYGAGITSGSNPLGISAGPDGNIWFTEYGGNRIGMITPTGPATGSVIEYTVGITSNSGPTDITAGPDGNLWFTENTANQIGVIMTDGRMVGEYNNGITPNAGLFGITSGANGNIWFAEKGAGQIGEITPDGQQVTEFSVPTPGASPNYITTGPDGNLWFTEGDGNKIGQITLDGTVTEFTINQSISTGPMGITLGADGNLWFAEYNASAIGRLSGVLAATNTTLSSSDTAPVVGEQVVFTANVSVQQSAIRTPLTGVVTFYDGSRVLGASAVSGGIAVISTDALSAGTHTVTASYAGNPSFSASTSAPVNEQVTAADTTTTVTPPGVPSTYGQVVTFIANVSANNSVATPTGAISFYDGNTLLGTATLSGGMAMFSTANLSAGDHSQITARFTPTANFNPSASTPVDQQVLKAGTTTALSTSASQTVFGQTIVLTATVTSSSPAAPTGTISFYDGTTLLGTSALSGGVASLSTSALTAGDHPNVYASYTPTANFLGSISATPLDERVSQATTNIVVASVGAPVGVGQALVYTATVTSTTSSAVPTGYVTFFDNGSVIGISTLSGGVAVLTTSSTVAGSHAINATYNPTGNFGSSSDAPIVQQVNPGVASQLLFGQQPTFTLANKVFTQPLTVMIADAWGNKVDTNTAVTIAIASNPGSAILSGTTTVNAFHGVVTFANLTLNKKGSGYTLAAAATGLTKATSAAFTVSPTANFAITAPATVQAGALFNITVAARDSANVIDPLYQGTIQITSSDPQGRTLVSSYTFTTADKGQHTFANLRLSSVGNQTIAAVDTHVISAVGSKLVRVTSPPVQPTITAPVAGVATQLLFGQQPTFTLANKVFTQPVTVMVADAFGNAVDTNSTVTIAIANNPNSASLSGTRTVTAVHGIATFTNLMLTRKGSGYTLAATSTGLTKATSAAFTVSPTTHLTITAPTSVPAGALFSITVVARDSASAIDPLYQGTIQITSTDPQGRTLVFGYTFTTADKGQHTFTNLRLTTASNQTITAVDLNVASVLGTRQVTVTA
jgi:streptogramin lyase